MKKIIAVLSIAMLLISIAPVSVSAKDKADTNTTLYEVLQTEGALEKIDATTVQENSSEKQTMSKAIKSKIDNNTVLEELSLSSNNIESFYNVSYDYNSDIKYESEFDSGAVVSYDENMNIIAYSNFDRNSDNTPATFTAPNNDMVIEALKQEYGIDETYAIDINDNDNGDIVYYWEKIDENGYRNIYDALSVRIDGITNKIVTFNRFNDSAKSTETSISETEAKSIALNLKEEFNQVTGCTKEYVKPNFLWNEEEILYENADIVRLVYNVCIDNIYFVHVDAETGEVIGGDMLMGSNNAGSYSYTDMFYSNASVNLAKTAFSKLGYLN